MFTISPMMVAALLLGALAIWCAFKLAGNTYDVSKARKQAREGMFARFFRSCVNTHGALVFSRFFRTPRR